MLWLGHHLAMDHITMESLTQEAQSYLLGEADRLPDPLPFRNFVAQARLGISQAEHEAFFRSILGGVDEPTAPYGLLDAQGDGSSIEEVRMELETNLDRRLRERARALGISAASVCHLAWAQVLARVSAHVSRRDDVVFGTVLFGRMHGGEGADRGVGLFINTLPIRIRISDEGVERSARQTHELLADLMRHEHASLALAQRCSGVAAPTPLFSSLLNYRHSPREVKQSPEAALVWAGIESLDSEERTNYPLALSVEDLGDGFALTAQAAPPVDPGRVCEYMRTALEGLVEALEKAPGTAVNAIDVMPETERRRVSMEWNATETAYPREKCVHELFEEQVEKNPDVIALAHEDRSLTYKELNARANQLAHHLCGLGVGPDARVAICVERGIEMVIALLATLKAGGAYVPLDPTCPPDRLAYMLEDSSPVAVLTSSLAREALAARLIRGTVVDLDTDAMSWAAQSERNLTPTDVGLDRSCLAYVIYTSGSTGSPKGVMVEHQSLVNYLTYCVNNYVSPVGNVYASFLHFPLTFDASITSLFAPLIIGRAIDVNPKGNIDTFKEGEFLNRGYDFIKLTPSHLSLLRSNSSNVPEEYFQKKNLLIVGGESLTRDHVDFLSRPNVDIEIVNEYGPTEATVGCTTSRFSIGKSEQEGSKSVGNITIGTPIANTRIHIMSGRLEPAPIGVAGGIYIGGAGVARGYIDHPELTAERFLPDPFGRESGARVYKTGDLGRWLPDGAIEFLGRNDFQVKIRGFRIELGEIEARLAMPS